MSESDPAAERRLWWGWRPASRLTSGTGEESRELTDAAFTIKPLTNVIDTGGGYENRCWAAKMKVKVTANELWGWFILFKALLQMEARALDLRQADVVFLATFLTKRLNYSLVLIDVFCLHPFFSPSTKVFQDALHPNVSAIPSCPWCVASSWLWIIELRGKAHLCNLNKLTPSRSNLK